MITDQLKKIKIMKTSKLSLTALMAAALLMAGCSSMSKTGQGALYGGGGGAALGAGIGALAGGGKGAAIGAAVGAGVGAGAGALVGKKMDKKEKEIAQKLEKEAQVEQVEDQNGFQAIKVTFAEGILFGFNSTKLSPSAQEALTKFANTIDDEPEMDVTIYGHTDNVGTHQVNEKVSTERAQAVSNFLLGHGVPSKQIIVVKGLAYDSPVADNSTEAGRAKNRRVEIFLTANNEMVKKAEAGTLQ